MNWLRHGLLPSSSVLGVLLVTLVAACLGSYVGAQATNARISGTGAAQNTGSARLLIISKQGHTLAIVDPANLRVLAKVPVGEDPHEVVASTDGTTAYVSNYGGGTLDTLSVVDLTHAKSLSPINLGPLRGPHGLTFVGRKTWFTAEAANAIGRYDPATHKVDWILGTGQNRTHMIYVSEDQKHIVTTNVSSGTVSLIEQQTAQPYGTPAGTGAMPPQLQNWNQTVVKVGNRPEGFDLSPDGKELWVANGQDGTISVIDYATKSVVDTLAANVTGANRLKFTKDGQHVLVSLVGGPDLVVLDSATRKVIKRLPIGHGAEGILIDPSGNRAFVACTPDNYVAIIDLTSMEVMGHLDAGGQPDGMAWVIWP